MKTVLQINSSLFQQRGQSSQLGMALVEQLLGPQDQIIIRDLAAEPVPHLTAERFAAFTTPEAERTDEQQATVDYSDALIAELRSADVIVLGLPMYNFSVPSTLKAYFDHMARVGVTFRYTSNGPEGLLTGKKAYVLATRGGNYQDTPMDTQEPFVRIFLGFIGITDVEFIYAEGLARGEALRAQALDEANASIHELAA